MNIAEANLVLGSLDDLSRTLMANKLERNRAGETQQRIGLAGEEMALRREDAASDRQFREREVTAREAGAKSLEQYRQDMIAAKTEDEKLTLMKDLFASGLVDENAKAGFEKAMSDKLGVQVTLKLPKAKPGFETREGHDLALAENYRERARAAMRNGGGEEAERFNAIAERLERGGRPEAEPMADVTEEVGEVDPLTGKGAASVRRKVPESRLDEVLRAKAGRAGAPPPAGGAPGAANGDRVKVISPDGKPGSVPRSQLDAALKQGYKVAQ